MWRLKFIDKKRAYNKSHREVTSHCKVNQSYRVTFAQNTGSCLFLLIVFMTGGLKFSFPRLPVYERSEGNCVRYSLFNSLAPDDLRPFTPRNSTPESRS